MKVFSLISISIWLYGVVSPVESNLITDLEFCRKLPKLECHAHLNGSIPRATFLKLRKEAASRHPELASEFPFDSHTIEKFFGAFQNDIYKVTDNPEAVSDVTNSVLQAFEEDGCIYLELRTTPRSSEFMDKEQYLDTVLKAIESYDQTNMRVRLLVSVDWKHSTEEALAIIDLAQKQRGRGVVGIDVCGNPAKSHDYQKLVPALEKAREEYGMKVTVHFSEIKAQGPYLNGQLSGLKPDRLGHATFLTNSAQQQVIRNKLPIEICITSNVLGKTVRSVEEHHLRWAVKNEVPVLISTDDTLLFETTSTNEHRLALRILDGDRELLLKQIKTGIGKTFATDEDKTWMRSKMEAFERSGLVRPY